MFKRQTTKGSTKHKNLIKILPASVILAENKRQPLLDDIRAYMALEDARYESLCDPLVNHLIAYCQNLPDSSNRYYTHAGGLIDHALQRTEAALGLFKAFALKEGQEKLSEEQSLWQYALYSAAMLQGIGKLYAEYKIHLFDSHGQHLKPWNPLMERLDALGHFYDYQFEKASEETFRRRLNLLIARQIIPERAFHWIASNPEVLAVWLALLNEDEQSAGTLGLILIRANAIALQRYYLQLLGKGGLAMGRRFARVGAFADKHQMSLDDKERMAGIEFLNWLHQALAEGKIALNKSPLFAIPGGLLISSEAFKWFLKEHGEYHNWQAVEKGFLSLGHHDTPSKEVLETHLPADKQEGFILKDYALVLPDEVSVYHQDSGRHLQYNVLALVQSVENVNQFVRGRIAAPPAIQQLNQAGQWQTMEQKAAGLQFSVKGRG